MKRQKRDKTTRAYSRGYQAGLQGRSRDLCPFGDMTSRTSWQYGWREGRADQWAGMTGVSGIHKVLNNTA